MKFNNSLTGKRIESGNIRLLYSLILAGCFLLLSIMQTLAQDKAWNKVKERDGILIFQRQYENSKVLETKGQMIITAELSSLLSLFKNIQAYPKWVYNCISSKTIARISMQEQIIYTVIKTPFPYKNRDMFVNSHVRYDRDSRKIIIKLTGIENYSPLVKGRIRIKKLSKRFIPDFIFYNFWDE